MPSGGLGSVYIAKGVQREPLDQTDLKDGVDAIPGGDGGSFLKLTGRGHLPGRATPWWGRLAPPGSPSGFAVAWCPLRPSGAVFVMVKFSSI
jgi:hypothetical protein